MLNLQERLTQTTHEEENPVVSQLKAFFSGEPRISATKVKLPDGTHVTRVTRDGVVLSETPTPASEIREPRTSCLYQHRTIADMTFKRITRKQ
jgi:hypothetical protein